MISRSQISLPRNAEAPKTYIFQDIDENTLQIILNNSTLEKRESGTMIVQQGDNPSHLYFIVSGSVRTTRLTPGGDEATMRLLKAGDTFMDAVIFMGIPSPINAEILEDAELLKIPREVVFERLQHDSIFARNLLRIVTYHYKNSMKQIDSMLLRSPVQRLGMYLLDLHLEQDPASTQVKLPFKKATLANYLGMKPETLSRALQQIKKLGIEVDADTLHLKDVMALCRFCDEETVGKCPRFKTDECPLDPDGLLQINTNGHSGQT